MISVEAITNTGPLSQKLVLSGQIVFGAINIGISMHSLFLALSEIIMALIARPKVEPPPPQPQKKISSNAPEGYMQYHFCCWLCSGQTGFSCPIPTQEVFFNLDCCRCGIENRVKVEPAKTK